MRVSPRTSIIGMTLASRSRAAARMAAVLAVGWGSVWERVAREKSSKRRRRTTVRPIRPAGPHAPGDAVDQPDEHHVDGLDRSAASARARAATPIEPRRRPTCTGRGSRLWARACRCRPDARPSMATSAGLGQPGDVGHGGDAPGVQLLRRDRADAPQALHRQRVEEGELAVGRHDEQAVRLGHAAGHLGQELGPGHPDGDGQPDAFPDLAAQPDGDLGRRAREPAQARRRRGTPRRWTAPSTSGVVSSNTSNTALLAAEYAEKRGATTIAWGHSRRACAAAHRRAHAVRLGLVARRQHDPAADDDRPARAGAGRPAARRTR